MDQHPRDQDQCHLNAIFEPEPTSHDRLARQVGSALRAEQRLRAAIRPLTRQQYLPTNEEIEKLEAEAARFSRKVRERQNFEQSNPLREQLYRTDTSLSVWLGRHFYTIRNNLRDARMTFPAERIMDLTVEIRTILEGLGSLCTNHALWFQTQPEEYRAAFRFESLSPEPDGV